MRLKLRYVLPLAQMLLAVALYRWSDLWLIAQNRISRHEPYDGPSAPFDLLVALNAPLTLVRILDYRYLPELWSRTVFILAIGLMWYFVALNFESFFAGRGVLTFSRKGVRSFADFFLVATGLLCPLESIHNWAYLYPDIPYSWCFWLSALLRATWMVALIFFFGRDLVESVRLPRPSH